MPSSTDRPRGEPLINSDSNTEPVIRFSNAQDGQTANVMIPDEGLVEHDQKVLFQKRLNDNYNVG
jgi:hypothetical protein